MKLYFLACFAILSIYGNLWAGDTQHPERYYYQKEWGTPAFQLLRSDPDHLVVSPQSAGSYSFREDWVAIDDWVHLEATWTNLDGVKVFALVLDQNGNQWKSRMAAREGKNSWTPADFDLIARRGDLPPPSQPDQMEEVGWQLMALRAVQPVLSDCRVVLKENIQPNSLTLFVDHADPLPFYLPPVSTPSISKIDHQKSRIILPETGFYVDQEKWADDWIAWGQREFSAQFGFDVGAPVVGRLAGFVKKAHQAGQLTLFESHKDMPNCLAWVRNHQYSAQRFDGFSPDQPIWPTQELPLDGGNVYFGGVAKFHLEDRTREEIYNMTLDRMNAVFDLGYDNFLLIDYTWPYFGGRWGYGPAAVTQWKNYLKGTAPKLDLVAPVETWSFADYWRQFSSVALTPDSFGWKTWGDFTCGTEQGASEDPIAGRRLLLFNALWHFHHLVFLDRLGGEAEQRGRELSISINTEDVSEGCDVSMYSRLRHLGGVGFEFFGDPLNLTGWDHTLPWLRSRGTSPAIDLIGELSTDGHGASRYDRDTSFVFYYDATSSCKLRYYNNQYPEESSWSKLDKLDSYHLERFDEWFAGANAFLLRQKEEKETPVVLPKVTVVASRSVVEYEDNSTNLLTQDGNLAPYLAAANVNFVQVGRDVWPQSFHDDSSVLIYSPDFSTLDQLKAVRQWIETGKGRTLVIHGGAAWRCDMDPKSMAVAPAFLTGDRKARRDRLVAGLVPTTDSIFPLAGKSPATEIVLNGQKLTTCVWNAEAADKKVLLQSDNGIPLLVQWTIGENTILHVTADLPPMDFSSVGLAIIEKLELPAFADPLPDWDCHTLDVSGGKAVVAWNRPILHDQETRNRYNLTKLETPVNLGLRVSPGQNYTIYSVLDDHRWSLKSDATGLLNVGLTQSPQMIYYGLETPEFNHTLAAASDAYQKTLRRTRTPALAASPSN